MFVRQGVLEALEDRELIVREVFDVDPVKEDVNIIWKVDITVI